MMRLGWLPLVLFVATADAASLNSTHANSPTTNGAIVYGMASFDTASAGGRGDIAVPVPKAVSVGPMHCTTSVGTGGATATYTFRLLRSTDSSASFAALSPSITCTTAANTGRSCNYTGSTAAVAAGDTLIFEWSCTGTGNCTNSGVVGSCTIVAQ